MLIYTTMRNVQGEDKDRLPVSILVSASHVKQHTPNRTEKMSYMGLRRESVDDG